ncbi:FkbM family methyltransferase [Nostoc sp.]|uniref:FkbM family methyltransferase n=1 Tax=Nostoc sp. TaxID=1180 RepID=UPI002FFB3B18
MCKVSVIIPIWNSERYLAEAIESVINQTFPDFELIALDDGSTDQSLQILKNFAQKDSRIKIISCEHQGYSPLLNLGLSMAKGEYIARMDSDDICISERFEKQVAFLDSHLDYVAVGSQALRIDPEGDPIGYINFPLDHDAIDTSQMNGKGKIMHPASMIRQKVLLEINGYRPEFEPGEDYDLFLRLAEVGKLANLPNVLLKYRMHTKNVTVEKKEHHQRVKQQALQEAYNRQNLNQERVPTILINDSPSQESDFRFLWMEMALSYGSYQSARKNAWLGFQSKPLSKHSIKSLIFGFGGIMTSYSRKIYHTFFPVFRERPVALLVGLIGRSLDYAKAAIDRIKSLIPKEMYTLALLCSYLQWTGGRISRPVTGLFKIHTKFQNKDVNILLRSQSSDIMTFTEVIMSREYAPVINLIQKEGCELAPLIIDAGANIGLSTIFFKSYFPKARVICIEPDSENVALLQKNLNENHLYDCDVIQAGLWYKDCNLAISHDFRDGLPWAVRVIEQEVGGIRGVGITSLLEVCLGQRIGLLKIDIEGSEFELFRRTEAILPLLERSDFVVVEIHQEFGDISEIQNLLSNNAFYTVIVGHLLVARKIII